MGTVPVYATLVGGGTGVVVSASTAGVVTISTTPTTTHRRNSVPVRGDVTGAAKFLAINVAADGSYTITRDTLGPGASVPLYGTADGYPDSLWVTDDSGVLAFSLGYAGTRTNSAWFAALSYVAADGSKPAAIADFRNWRFAITTVAVGSVAGASTAQLSVLQACTFAQWFAFTAASTTQRTRINPAGNVAADSVVDTPRQDYTNGVQQFALSDAAQNLCLQSNTFSDAAWTKTTCTVGTGAGLDPDGVSTAQTLSEGVASAPHHLDSTAISFTSGATYVFSIKARADTDNKIQLAAGSGAFSGVGYANFDCAGGTVLATGGTIVEAWVEADNDGWFRCKLKMVATASASAIFAVARINSATATRLVSYLGTGLQVQIADAQVEAEGLATAYIPTTSASVTRAIETARLSPTLEAILQRSAATIVVQGQACERDSGRIVGGATSDALLVRQASTTLRANKTANLDATSGAFDFRASWGAGIAFDGSGRSLCMNGGTVATDANGPGSRATVYLGTDASNTAFGDGFYDTVIVYPNRVSDAALKALAVPYVDTSAVDYLVVIAGHQSNMTGGQYAAEGGLIISPDDDPNALISQFSPNGGTATGDPAHALVLEQAVEPLRYPSGLGDGAVGPGLTYMKGILAQNPGQKLIILTGGKGGTSLTQWTPGQQYFDLMSLTYTALRRAIVALGKTWRLHSIILSPLENEMANAIPVGSVPGQIDLVFAAYRKLARASNAPIYMGAANPDYVWSDPTFRPILIEGGKAAARNPRVGVTGSLVGGAVPTDLIHYTNVANRVRGAWLANQVAITAAMNAGPPPAVSVLSLSFQTLTFTSTGAPYYTIDTRAVGDSGAWTHTDFIPVQDNAAGQVFTVTLPSASMGSRDCTVTAVSYGGSAVSPVVTYTAPVGSAPARTVELDFASATMSGANMVSVPSSGSDTTAWTPVANAGSGAAATITRVAQNAINVAALVSANQRFRRTGFTFPSGSYSFGFAFYMPAIVGAGALVEWGQNASAGDIFISLANGGVNIKAQNNTSSAAVTTTNAPLFGQTSKWHYVGVTYDSVANTLLIYLNGVLQPTTGTVNQRSGSPSNSGGTDLCGGLLDSASNGLICTMLPIRHWSSVLTAVQLQQDQLALASTYAVAFG